MEIFQIHKKKYNANSPSWHQYLTLRSMKHVFHEYTEHVTLVWQHGIISNNQKAHNVISPSWHQYLTLRSVIIKHMFHRSTQSIDVKLVWQHGIISNNYKKKDTISWHQYLTPRSIKHMLHLSTSLAAWNYFESLKRKIQWPTSLPGISILHLRRMTQRFA